MKASLDPFIITKYFSDSFELWLTMVTKKLWQTLCTECFQLGPKRILKNELSQGYEMTIKEKHLFTWFWPIITLIVDCVVITEAFKRVEKLLSIHRSLPFGSTWECCGFNSWQEKYPFILNRFSKRFNNYCCGFPLLTIYC